MFSLSLSHSLVAGITIIIVIFLGLLISGSFFFCLWLLRRRSALSSHNKILFVMLRNLRWLTAHEMLSMQHKIMYFYFFASLKSNQMDLVSSLGFSYLLRSKIIFITDLNANKWFIETIVDKFVENGVQISISVKWKIVCKLSMNLNWRLKTFKMMGKFSLLTLKYSAKWFCWSRWIGQNEKIWFLWTIWISNTKSICIR